jgi:hypothetical protein
MRKATLIAGAVGALSVLLFALGGSTALAKDRNHDRIPDRWEKRFHLSLKVDQANRDQDRDKVDNLNEFQEGTNPRDADTDNDDRKDGKEDADRDGLNNHNEDVSANLPDDPDTDNDGTEDGDEIVGTIASFQDPVLTISLAKGGSISGNVTADTRIRCRSEDEQEDENEIENENENEARSSHDGGSGDDNSGPGSENEGPGHDGGTTCTSADLVPGTPVHEAELEGGNFEKIDLLK